MSSLQKLSNNFLILPVTLHESVHYIYFKQHSDSVGNTLFLVNLPIRTTTNHLQRLFRRCGTVKSVNFLGSNCQVEFIESDAVGKCLLMKERRRVWSDDVSEIQEYSPQLFGIKKWISDFNSSHPPLPQILSRVQTHLQTFDQIQLDKSLALESKSRIPDEDGFITVIRKSHVKEEGRKRKKKSGELQNFYRFQIKDGKMKQLAELRDKFEKDKKKVQAMKDARRFNPY